MYCWFHISLSVCFGSSFFVFLIFNEVLYLPEKKKITAVTENLGSTGADLGTGVGVGVGVGAVPRHGNF